MSVSAGNARQTARLELVKQHVACENAHDLDGVMKTFGSDARYDDEPWNDHHTDRAGVRSYYAALMQSIPDLRIDVQNEHCTDDVVVLEVIIRGTHLGTWRGLPATGRTVAIPLCGIFTFDSNDRIAGEKIYYDRATVLQQLGVLYEPQSLAGQLTTAIMHPITITRALAGTVLKRRP